MLNYNKLKDYFGINYFLYCSIFVFLFVFVAVPFAFVLKSFFGDRNISFEQVLTFIKSAEFFFAIKVSLLYSTIASVISVFIAFILAYGISKTRIKLKKTLNIILLVPMIIPTFSISVGMMNLFGTGGIFSNIFGKEVNLYGMFGLITASVIYSYPVAYLIFNQVFKYEDSKIYEVAEVMGINRFRIFWAITLPRFRKTIIIAFFSVFVMIFSDFGISTTLSGKNLTPLPYLLYKYITQFKFPYASVISITILMPAIVYFIAVKYIKQPNSSENTVNVYFSKRKVTRFFYQGFTVLFAIFLLIFITSFFKQALFTDGSFNSKLFDSLKSYNVFFYTFNSIKIAILSAIIGTGMMYMAGYLGVRRRGYRTLMKGIDFLSTLSMLIPGLVLGLGYLLIFNRTTIYGTIVIVVFCNVAHFCTSPYMMSKTAFSALDENYEIIAKTLKTPNKKFVLSVIVPNTKFTIMEIFTYLFTNSMVTISAVSIIAGPYSKIKPVSLIISFVLSQNRDSLVVASSITAIIFLINVSVLLIFALVRKKYEYKRS